MKGHWATTIYVPELERMGAEEIEPKISGKYDYTSGFEGSFTDPPCSEEFEFFDYEWDKDVFTDKENEAIERYLTDEKVNAIIEASIYEQWERAKNDF